jgi:hypothetical protein
MRLRRDEVKLDWEAAGDFDGSTQGLLKPDLGFPCPGPLLDFLARKEGAIGRLWLERALQGYAKSTTRFLAQEQDRFRNPVGYTLKENLPVLYTALLLGRASDECQRALDAIIRVRAVQDFSASQAVSFIFMLKDIVRQELAGEGQIDPDGRGLAAFETRIDALALLAFDLFVRCREQICEIKTNDVRRRTYVEQKLAANSANATRNGSE